MQRLSVIKNGELSEALASSFDSANLVKLETKSFNGVQLTAANCNFIGLNGDADTRYQIVISGACSGDIFLQFNGDTSATNYYEGYLAQNASSALASAVSSSARGVRLTAYGSPNVFVIADIDAKTSNKPRLVNSRCTAAGGSTINGSSSFGAWLNTLANITSIALNQNSSSTVFSGTITLYKWQDVKLTSLASMEVVKEYNLNNQTLNDTFSYDGETYPDLFIFSDLTASAVGGSINMRFNGDTGNNYPYSYIEQTGSSVPAASGTGSILYAGVVSDSGVSCISEAHAFLKLGGVRRCLMRGGRRVSGYEYQDVWSSYWSNTTAPITSVTLITPGNVTGNIKVMRLVTSQLLKQNFNPIELVLNKDYSNASVFESIDVSDCDELEIALLGSSSNDICTLRFNNDTLISNYKLTYVMSQGASTLSNFGNGSNNNTINGTTQNGSCSFARIHVYPTIKKFDCRLNYDSSTYQILQHHAQQWNGAAKAISVQIVCSSGFSGRIKVWKKY